MYILRCIIDIQDKLQVILIKWDFLWSINPLQIGGEGRGGEYARMHFGCLEFFNAKPSNLITFHKIYLETIWH